MKELKHERLDLVKIDIEGSEVMALEGAKTTFKKYFPDLMIETHVVNHVSTSGKVLETLKKVGYTNIEVTNEGKGLDFIYAKKSKNK